MISFSSSPLVDARHIGCIFCLVSMGCDSSPSTTTMVFDSSGVQIVTSSKASHQLAWTLDTVRLIGGAEIGPAAFYVVRPSLIDVDAFDHLYVLDATQYHVAVFDANGGVLRTVGRRGHGPGELAGPVTVSAAPNGDVLVLDGGRGVVVRYDTHGNLVGESPYPFGIVNINFRHIEATGSGVAMWMRDLFNGNRARYDRLVWLADADTVVLRGETPALRSTARYPECGMSFTVAVPLAPTLEWSQAGERLAVASPATYQVDLFEDGRLTRSVRVPGEALIVDRQGAEQLLSQAGVQGPCGADPRQLIARHGFHETVQEVRGVVLSPDGSMWVQRRGVGGGERIDVFNQNGERRGTLPAGFPMPLGFLSGGRLVTVVTDSLDIQRLGIVEVRQ